MKRCDYCGIVPESSGGLIYTPFQNYNEKVMERWYCPECRPIVADITKRMMENFKAKMEREKTMDTNIESKREELTLKQFHYYYTEFWIEYQGITAPHQNENFANENDAQNWIDSKRATAESLDFEPTQFKSRITKRTVHYLERN